jgi:hypothetical protein
MTIMTLDMPTVQRANSQGSKYDVIFAGLEAGSKQCHVETDFIDAKKMANRMNSAIAAYRERTGDKSAFAVRTTVLPGTKTEVVGVWKLAREFTPKTKSE